MTDTTVVTAGDRIRVARGVFGRTGHVRAAYKGHILIQYDDGGREIVDRTRRGMWVLARRQTDCSSPR